MNKKLILVSIFILALFNFSYSQNNSDYILVPKSEIKNISPSINSSLIFKTTPHIKNYISYYQGRGKVSMERMISRSGIYERMVRRIFREEDLPEDLWKLQIASDEWWDRTCHSWKYVKPLWHFPPKIAPKYGLRKNRYIDETKGFEKATRATAQYLTYLSKKYSKNWELALAAYNIGESNIDKLIKRKKTKDFWEIYPYLNKESRDFVPIVLAFILISKNPQDYGFENIKIESPISYDSVRVPSLIKLDLIAQLSDSNPQIIKKLNPEILTNITPPAPYIVRIPSEKVQTFLERVRRYTKDLKLKSE